MNEKATIIKWEGEYCGSFDFKSRVQEALNMENVSESGTGTEVEKCEFGEVVVEGRTNKLRPRWVRTFSNHVISLLTMIQTFTFLKKY